jgi:hypothetical protein
MQEDITYIDPADEKDLAGTLEDVLRRPRKSSADWQAEASKLASLAHIRALNSDTPDFEYLKLLALCRWAQKVGVVEAKKKNIQTIRFRTDVPPPLGLIGGVELTTASLELFVNLRASWCKDYISNELLGSSVDKKGLSLLLTWAEKISLSATGLIDTVLVKRLDSNLDEKRTILLIKDVSQKICFVHYFSSEASASDFLSAVQVITEKIKSCQSKKLASALVMLLQVLVQKVREAHPTVVIQGAFVLAIQAIQNQLLETAHKKAVSEIATQQIAPTMSALADLCQIGGIDAVNYSKLLLPSFKKAFMNFEKSFDEACRKNTALLPIKEAATGHEETHLEDTATSLYARLLPAWLDFYKSQKDPDQLSGFNADLLSAAKLNGIELLGTAGEVLTFDPVAHRLEGGETSHASRVSIVRPAVIFKRANSSYRIVLPAIVSLT